MTDRHDILRHVRVAQHASVRREKSQQFPDAPSLSGQVEQSTYGARASSHATPSFSFRKRWDSPSDASPPHRPASVRLHLPRIHSHHLQLIHSHLLLLRMLIQCHLRRMRLLGCWTRGFWRWSSWFVLTNDSNTY